MKQSFYWLLFLSILFIGCSEDDSEKGGDTSRKEVAGCVQKGPFITGTSVTVQELTNELTPTGRSFVTQIKEDGGSFALNGDFSEEYAELIANGYYFNEVEGGLSDSPITLRTLSKLSGKEHININVLTTLQSPRIQKLIGEGKIFEEAVAQSQKEVLKAFSIEQEGTDKTFDQWTIAQKGNENAILLAISSILQYGRNEAQLSEFVAKVANDIQDNGILDSQPLKEAIANGASQIDNYRVQENLRRRFKELGMTDVSIPDFYGYLDSDGDGELNYKMPYLNCPDEIWVRRGELTYTLNWSSNCNPTVETGGCKFMHIVECTNEKLVFTLTETTYKRMIQLPIKSSDNELIKTILISQEGTAMSFKIGLKTSWSDPRRSAFNFFDDKVSDIYIAAFDNQGKIAFVQKEDHPTISNNSYGFQINLDNKVYPECTIYAIINSPYDYSDFQGTLSDFCNLQSNVNLSTADNLENFYIGKVDSWAIDHSIGYVPPLGEVPIPVALMNRPIAKVECSVSFADDMPLENVHSLTLKGGVYYNRGSFFDKTTGSGTDLTLTTSDNNKYTTYLYSGSTIEAFDIKLAKSGKSYHVPVQKVEMRAGHLFRYDFRVNSDSASVSISYPSFGDGGDFDIVL